MFKVVYGTAEYDGGAYLFENIKENIIKNIKSYILVPEQFSVFTERRIIAAFGVSAQKNAEVLTFSRLSDLVLSELGPLRLNYIDGAGKEILAARTMQLIEKNLDYGPKYYDNDTYTDQTIRMIVEETIREKALKLLDDEVPHGLYVQVEKMNLRNTKNKEEIYDVEATIYCLRNSHKGIIIGKNGEMLKKIGMYARQDLEKMLGIKINLKTWVKVSEQWQDKDNIVKRFKIN